MRSGHVGIIFMYNWLNVASGLTGWILLHQQHSVFLFVTSDKQEQQIIKPLWLCWQSWQETHYPSGRSETNTQKTKIPLWETCWTLDLDHPESKEGTATFSVISCSFPAALLRRQVNGTAGVCASLSQLHTPKIQVFSQQVIVEFSCVCSWISIQFLPWTVEEKLHKMSQKSNPW